MRLALYIVLDLTWKVRQTRVKVWALESKHSEFKLKLCRHHLMQPWGSNLALLSASVSVAAKKGKQNYQPPKNVVKSKMS